MRRCLSDMNIVKKPNAETLEAIKEVEEMKRNPHLYKSFDSVEALFEELNNDDSCTIHVGSVDPDAP